MEIFFFGDDTRLEKLSAPEIFTFNHYCPLAILIGSRPYANPKFAQITVKYSFAYLVSQHIKHVVSKL
jgi:hypothetical protein